ncbi:MAG: CSLREA domain-containing protein, partial [Gammaproteobacteria bacterium]|nr:CSLREA domain-containing protein [Gammaproteobacteria bacterium]
MKLSRIVCVFLILVFMLSALPVSPAYAAGIIVDTNADNTNPGDNACTLREAINNANDDTGADTTGGDCAIGSIGSDTITVPAGTYTLTTNAELLTTSDMTINGAGANTTIIQAHASANTATWRVLHNNGGAIILNGLTFRHGRCNGSCDGSLDEGGGIINQAGNLTLDASTVSSNYATYGGGIYNEVSGETITIQNGSLIGGAGAGNQAITSGGGIYNRRGTMTIDASTVSANFATSHGGGIWTLQNLDIKNGSLIG